MARNSLKRISRLIDLAENTLTTEEAFLGDLKRSIELEDEANRHTPSPYYKPSSMNCIRNMYYQRIQAKEDKQDTDYANVGICNSGTDTHVRIQTYVSHMKDYGFDCEYVNVANYVKGHKLKDIQIISQQGMETKLLNTRYGISFLCDGIIKYLGEYYILELKTESSFKWLPRTGVAPEHYNQVTCYSLSLNIPKAIFVYINRDTLNMKSFMIEPTDEMKANIVGLIENCETCVKKLKVPEKPVDVPKKTCTYCRYKSQCRKDS